MPLISERSEFFSLVPRRLQLALSGSHQVVVFYCGTLDERILRRHGVEVVRYGGPLASVPGVRLLALSLFAIRHSRELDLEALGNVWNHHLAFLLAPARAYGVTVFARVAGQPFRFRARSGGLAGIRGLAARFLEGLSLSVADRILTLGPDMSSRLLNSGLRSSIVAVSQGCDTDRIAFRPHPPSLAGDVLFIGRLTRRKGILVLPEIVRCLERVGVERDLVVAGDGPLRSWLERERNALPNPDRMRLIGGFENEGVREILMRATALVLPSLTESLPNVILESMAAGVPVVASGTGEVPGLLAEGRGIALPVGSSARDYADAVRQICQDERGAREMAARARSFVERNHSLARVGHIFRVEVLGEVVS